MKPIDLVGMVFNKLTVRRLDSKKGENRRWLCSCECGGSTVVLGYNLKGGNVKSCGCLKLISPNRSHGMAGKPFYNVWNAMIQRCTNPNNIGYVRYGLRGIKVHQPWLKFVNFRDDMFSTYKSGLTIERIDNNGPYAPWNCKWATHAEQATNTRKAVWVRYNGQNMTISQAVRASGISEITISKYRDRDLGVNPTPMLAAIKRNSS